MGSFYGLPYIGRNLCNVLYKGALKVTQNAVIYHLVIGIFVYIYKLFVSLAIISGIGSFESMFT